MNVGKCVRGDCYFHVSLLKELSWPINDLVNRSFAIANRSKSCDFNVVKIHRSGNTVSLLNYPHFYEEPFPSLSMAWSVDLTSGICKERTYNQLGNPPILHRKELLISSRDSRYQTFKTLSDELDQLGILPNAPGLGFKNKWDQYLRFCKAEINNHTLQIMGGK